ncbi:MAG: LUD domain-containing protein [Desulfitobacterium sp.]|nr:LUD domain-containing protein [Desulfitobacterium sp.]
MGDKNVLYEKFRGKLEGVSGECYRVARVQDVEKLVGKILKNKGIDSVAMVKTPIIMETNLEESLKANGVEVYTDNYQEVTPKVAAGITEMKWAIAELGTLVQYAEDVNERLCSSFTPVHIALVRTKTLLPDIMTALGTIHKEPHIPEFVGFITGPSRTSDIERVLTIGVHGPEELVAIFIDE